MTDALKVSTATVSKDKGNAAFKEGRMSKAVRYYEKAVSCVNYDKGFPDELKATARQVSQLSTMRFP